MSSIERAFVAVVPPPEVLAAVALLSVPDDGLRWSRPEQRHVTLQFLGRVDDVDALTESVTESVRRIAPFTLALGGAGAFPSPRRASVVWLGVSTGAEELAELAGAIAMGTAPLGFVDDDRPFRPHLTLARVNATRDVRALVERLRTGLAGPPWTVDQVVLFDSDTRAEGAVHTVRARFPLDA